MLGLLESDAEAATGGVLLKTVLLKISPKFQENTFASVSFLIKLQTWPCNTIKKETLAQVLSCAFSEIFKSTFFIEHLRTTAFGDVLNYYCLDEPCTPALPESFMLLLLWQVLLQV